MRQLGVLAIGIAVLASQAGAMQVLPRWAVMSRAGQTWELKPHERTRPIIVGDVIYFANLSGQIFAMHRTANYLLWQTKVPGGVDGALSYGRSKLYVGDTQGNLIALHARDGSEAWRFKTQSEWLSPPLVVRDRVYAATSSDELFALSDSDGKELWHFSHRGDEKMTIRGTSGPAAYGGEVYQGFSDGHLVALGAVDGKVRWTKRLRTKERFYDVDTTPYVDDRRVVAATYDGKVYSLDRMTGDLQWVFPAGSYGGFLAEGDRLYFAGLDGAAYALEKASGSVVWKRELEKKGVGLAPAKVDNFILLTTSSDPVYLIDQKNGEIVWTGRLGAGTLAGPVAGADNWFYCFSNYGNLFSFEILKDARRYAAPKTLAVPSAL